MFQSCEYNIKGLALLAPSVYIWNAHRRLTCHDLVLKSDCLCQGDEDVSASAEEAVKLYELACKGKNGPACRSAMFAHLNGEGTPVNVEKGLEYGAIACEQVTLCTLSSIFCRPPAPLSSLPPLRHLLFILL